MRNDLRTYLSRELKGVDGERLVAQVRMRDSHRDHLLQLADYAAGLANRFLTGRPGSADLIQHFLPQLRSIRIWPDN